MRSRFLEGTIDRIADSEDPTVGGTSPTIDYALHTPRVTNWENLVLAHGKSAAHDGHHRKYFRYMPKSLLDETAVTSA
jgi:hypothetical protein